MKILKLSLLSLLSCSAFAATDLEQAFVIAAKEGNHDYIVLNINGVTPRVLSKALKKAAKKRRTHVCFEIIKQLDPQKDQDALNKGLLKATTSGLTEVCEKLIEKVSHQTTIDSALMKAAEKGWQEIYSLLAPKASEDIRQKAHKKLAKRLRTTPDNVIHSIDRISRVK